MPKNQNFKLFFDNWFCSLQLWLQLKSLWFLVTATIRADCVKGCPLPTEKDMKKKGRGAHAYKTDANSGLTVTKWFDNKCIQLASTYCNPDSVSFVRRWKRTEKSVLKSAAQQYCPKNMGGVDLSDMLIALYRTTIKIKRWYLKVLFHCVDISKVNSWLLYRRHCQQLGIPRNRQLSLLKFTVSIATVLVHANSIVNSVGCLSKRRANGSIGENSRKKSTSSPIVEIRFDSTSHWPECKSAKRKCKLCKAGQSRIYCLKCQVCLCIKQREKLLSRLSHKIMDNFNPKITAKQLVKNILRTGVVASQPARGTFLCQYRVVASQPV